MPTPSIATLPMPIAISGQLALDLIMVLLLCATVVSALVLYRRLNRLRRAEDNMREIAQTLDSSVRHAGESVDRLKISTETLREDISRAEQMAADLHELVARSGAAADRLEESIRQSRQRHEPAARRTVAPVTDAGADAAAGAAVPIPPRSRSERALIDALRLAG